MNLNTEEISSYKKDWIKNHLLLTKKAVAELLSCSIRTVERMVEDGDLVVYSRYPGRSVRFLCVDVEKYIISIKK